MTGPKVECEIVEDFGGSVYFSTEEPTGPRGTVLSSDGRLAELDHVSGQIENTEQKEQEQS